MSIIPASEATKISNENANKKTIEDYRSDLKNAFDMQLKIGKKFAKVEIVKGFDSDQVDSFIQDYRDAGYVVNFKHLNETFDLIEINWY